MSELITVSNVTGHNGNNARSRFGKKISTCRYIKTRSRNKRTKRNDAAYPEVIFQKELHSFCRQKCCAGEEIAGCAVL